jgi:hypothetical protein
MDTVAVGYPLYGYELSATVNVIEYAAGGCDETSTRLALAVVQL